jgi:hypothetical protein
MFRMTDKNAAQLKPNNYIRGNIPGPPPSWRLNLIVYDAIGRLKRLEIPSWGLSICVWKKANPLNDERRSVT